MTEAEEAQYNAMSEAFETERAINKDLRKANDILITKLNAISAILEGDDADDF